MQRVGRGPRPNGPIPGGQSAIAGLARVYPIERSGTAEERQALWPLGSFGNEWSA